MCIRDSSLFVFIGGGVVVTVVAGVANNDVAVVVVWGVVVVGGVSAVSDGVVKLDVGLVPVTVLLLGVGVGSFLG